MPTDAPNATDSTNNILVSFCNERFVPELSLGLLDPVEHRFRWVETGLGHSVTGAAGLARRNGKVYVAYQSRRPGPRLVAYHEETFTPIFEYGFRHTSDVHSIAFMDDSTILAVSTGTDEIYRLELDSHGSVVSEHLWWRFPGTYPDLADQTHCNSVATDGSEVFVTWCNSRGAARWLPAHSGGILRVSDAKLLATGLTSPHSLLVDGEEMYVCANPGKVVRVRDMAHVEIGGFARGLAKMGRRLYAGSSAERILSRSTEKKGLLSWTEFQRAGARIAVLDTTTLDLVAEVDLRGLGMEIFDLLPVSTSFDAKGVIADDPLRSRAQMLAFKMFERAEFLA